MSQVLLGFRNLSLRIAVFVALAALLAWFLGGDLFGSRKQVPRRTVTENGVSARTVLEYNPDSVLSDRIRWSVEINAGHGLQKVDRHWEDATDPVISPEDHLFVGALLEGRWGVWEIDRSSSAPTARLVHEFPDRLEVERQLARVAYGFQLQSPDTAATTREDVLRQGDVQ